MVEEEYSLMGLDVAQPFNSQVYYIGEVPKNTGDRLLTKLILILVLTSYLLAACPCSIICSLEQQTPAHMGLLNMNADQ